MQVVSAFCLRDRYLIHPNKRTSAGVWLSQPDYVSLPLESTAEEIGETVIASLKQSIGVMPHPKDWSGHAKPRLDAAGVRTESAFVNGAKLVEVRLDGDYFLEPHNNGGPRGDQRGFASIPERRLVIPAASSAKEIGAALATAFSACSDLA